MDGGRVKMTMVALLWSKTTHTKLRAREVLPVPFVVLLFRFKPSPIVPPPNQSGSATRGSRTQSRAKCVIHLVSSAKKKSEFNLPTGADLPPILISLFSHNPAPTAGRLSQDDSHRVISPDCRSLANVGEDDPTIQAYRNRRRRLALFCAGMTGAPSGCRHRVEIQLRAKRDLDPEFIDKYSFRSSRQIELTMHYKRDPTEQLELAPEFIWLNQALDRHGGHTCSANQSKSPTWSKYHRSVQNGGSSGEHEPPNEDSEEEGGRWGRRKQRFVQVRVAEAQSRQWPAVVPRENAQGWGHGVGKSQCRRWMIPLGILFFAQRSHGDLIRIPGNWTPVSSATVHCDTHVNFHLRDEDVFEQARIARGWSSFLCEARRDGEGDAGGIGKLKRRWRPSGNTNSSAHEGRDVVAQRRLSCLALPTPKFLSFIFASSIHQLNRFTNNQAIRLTVPLRIPTRAEQVKCVTRIVSSAPENEKGTVQRPSPRSAADLQRHVDAPSPRTILLLRKGCPRPPVHRPPSPTFLAHGWQTSEIWFSNSHLPQLSAALLGAYVRPASRVEPRLTCQLQASAFGCRESDFYAIFVEGIGQAARTARVRIKNGHQFEITGASGPITFVARQARLRAVKSEFKARRTHWYQDAQHGDLRTQESGSGLVSPNPSLPSTTARILTLNNEQPWDSIVENPGSHGETSPDPDSILTLRNGRPVNHSRSYRLPSDESRRPADPLLSPNHERHPQLPPPEILTAIFALAKRSALTFSHVSRQWRDAATNDSSLWLKTLLARSKGRAISLTLDFSDLPVLQSALHEFQFYRLLNAVIPHIPRTRELHIHAQSRLWSWIVVALATAKYESLEVLDLETIIPTSIMIKKRRANGQTVDATQPAIPSVFPFPKNHPRLKDLRLIGTSIGTIPIPRLNHLRVGGRSAPVVVDVDGKLNPRLFDHASYLSFEDMCIPAMAFPPDPPSDDDDDDDKDKAKAKAKKAPVPVPPLRNLTLRGLSASRHWNHNIHQIDAEYDCQPFFESLSRHTSNLRFLHIDSWDLTGRAWCDFLNWMPVKRVFINVTELRITGMHLAGRAYADVAYILDAFPRVKHLRLENCRPGTVQKVMEVLDVDWTVGSIPVFWGPELYSIFHKKDSNRMTSYEPGDLCTSLALESHREKGHARYNAQATTHRPLVPLPPSSLQFGAISTAKSQHACEEEAGKRSNEAMNGTPAASCRLYAINPIFALFLCG
ncbi:hypothetical protein FB45DRAFT_876575 [Roridomyces roridus]|uniref:F-box domain-containing protein n=1 Tax=Roridomyces roridus TaxID=1738132 RepID=A0AAD7B4C5_9AGAR|nr:hypothetical protein FB45DRAFT_876575 [Roridomyces roridus]